MILIWIFIKCITYCIYASHCLKNDIVIYLRIISRIMLRDHIGNTIYLNIIIFRMRMWYAYISNLEWWNVVYYENFYNNLIYLNYKHTCWWRPAQSDSNYFAPLSWKLSK